MLRVEVDHFMDHVLQYVHVDVNEHELAALTSFAYNLGVGAMKRSTLLRKLNSGDKGGAAHEFATAGIKLAGMCCAGWPAAAKPKLKSSWLNRVVKAL